MLKEYPLNLDWNYSQTDINWEDLSQLYNATPLGKKEPKNLETVFSNSRFKCFVSHKGTIIGVGRALADGADCSYLCDIAALPSYQGKGIGSDIVQKLIELSKGHTKIVLYSISGAEPFYIKLGFNRMNTAMAIFEDKDRALKVGLTRRK